MSYYTMPPAQTQHPPDSSDSPAVNPDRSYLIDKKRSLLEPLGRCPKAQTLIGYFPERDSFVIAELPCQNWSCRQCAERKVKRLAALTREAKPNRMLTLTVDPSKWENPRAAFDGTRRQVSELIKKLRSKFGEVEYLRVTELTKQGWPHYHLLIRSAYIPHAVVKALWEELTGARIVDVRQVHKTFRAYTYLVKYLSKLHKIEWTARHVSYSKGFFKKEEKRTNEPLPLEKKSICAMHPITYLLSHHKGDHIRPFTASTWEILEKFRHEGF